MKYETACYYGKLFQFGADDGTRTRDIQVSHASLSQVHFLPAQRALVSLASELITCWREIVLHYEYIFGKEIYQKYTVRAFADIHQ